MRRGVTIACVCDIATTIRWIAANERDGGRVGRLGIPRPIPGRGPLRYPACYAESL